MMTPSRVSTRRARKQRRRPAARRHPRRDHAKGVLLGFLLWSVVLVLHYAGGTLQYTDAAVGQRAASTVVATVSFTYPDQSQTELKRRQAADEVLPVFRIDSTAIHTASRTLRALVERGDPTRPALPAAPAADTNAPTGALPGFPLGQTLPDAPPGGEVDLLQAIQSTMESVCNRGILSEAERDSRFEGVAGQGAISIHDGSGTLRSPVALETILLPQQAAEQALETLRQAHPELSLPTDPLVSLLSAWAAPNLRYDDQQTEAARAEAQKRVRPVDATVPAGSTLVEAGQRITPQTLAALTAHAQRCVDLESPKDRFLDRVGHASLLFLTLIVALGLMHVLTPDTIPDAKAVALFGLMSLAVLAPAKLLLVLSATSERIPPALVQPMVPIGLAPLLGAILLRGPAAVIMGIWTTLVAAIFFGNSFFMVVLGLVVTVVAAGSAGDIHRRSTLVRTGLFIALSSIATVLCFAALNQQSALTVGIQMAAALASGLLTALLAVLLIPVFEWLFDLTTDITLLELSDMGHPVLSRLALEAPGTYHHSLMVANLAQAAASRIGANSLLVRVCAYYHDIGKLTKPEFFVENTQFSQNPHDDLAPSMSALVIISHVKEGLALAQRHKLPKPILDGIEQHHGTSLIMYFYHRAVRQRESKADGGGSRPVRDDDFRYPGPKPRSQEMGILLLADSVEAASRSMEKPTAARIEALVDDIVDSRLRDGQLDHCPLTFAHLTEIRDSFVFALTNMLHARVPYPKHENRDQQSTAVTPPPPGEPVALQSVGHASG